MMLHGKTKLLSRISQPPEKSHIFFQAGTQVETVF